MSITAALSGHGRDRPDRKALILDEDAIAWEALDRAVHALARWIAERVPPGRGLALDLPNCPALVLLFLAAARAGREAQIFDPQWPDAMAREIAELTRPALVVSTRTHSGATCRADPAWSFAEVAPALGAIQAGAMPEPDDLTPLYVGFTSGSTGRPKGFRRHHRSWLMSYAGEAQAFGTSGRDIFYIPGSFVHSLSVYALAGAIHFGATIVLARRFRPDRAVEAISRHCVTLMHAVPTQIALTARAAISPMPAMRLVTATGAPFPQVPRREIECAFPSARLVSFYGASELSVVTVGEDIGGSAGKPFPGVKISIRDRIGRRLPVRRIGAVHVESPLAFMEYATGEVPPSRIGAEISVGDRGFLDEEGALHLVGRANRMVIVAGRNIHPESVEDALIGHEAIAEAAVFGVADAVRGEKLVCFVKLAGCVSRGALVRYLREAMPGFRVPREFRVLRDWPLTGSGKSDLVRLAALWKARQGKDLE